MESFGVLFQNAVIYIDSITDEFEEVQRIGVGPVAQSV